MNRRNLIDEDVSIKKVFNVELIKTDIPNLYLIVDAGNDTTYEFTCSSDEEALDKFEQFADILNETNVQVKSITVE